MGNRRVRAAGMPRLDVIAVWTACFAVVAVLPGGFSRWVLPKLLIMAIAVLLALFAERTGRMPRWAWLCGLAVFASLVIAAIAGAVVLGGEVITGLVGRWPRYAGPIATLPVVFGAIWLGAALLGPRSDDAPRRALISGLSAAALLIGLVALAEAIGLRPFPSSLARPGSLLGNATDQGLVSAIITVVLLAGVPMTRADRTLRWLAPTALTAALVATALSGSRGAYLALAVGCVAVVVLSFVMHAPERRRIAAIGAGSLVVGAIAVAVVPGALARVTGADSLAAGALGDRWGSWSVAFQAFAAAPVTGLGSGSFIDRAPAFQPARWYADNPAGTTLESTHNWVLEAAIDGGVLLLLVLLVAAVLFGRDVWRRLRSAADAAAPLAIGSSAAILAATIALLAHPVGPAVLLLMALLGGALIGRAGAVVLSTGAQTATRISVIAWCAVLALSTVAEWPIQAGVSAAASDAEAADGGFAAASALRPWDADLTSIAAQSLTQALAGDPRALDQALRWTVSAVTRLPSSVAAQEARAVALEAAERWTDAATARGRVVELAPTDARARLDYAIDLAMGGDLGAALEQAHRVATEAPEVGEASVLVDRICAADPSLCS